MRPEKANIVTELAETLKTSPFLIVVDYTGMTVNHFEELRTRLIQADAECHVVKNTMLRRAIKELELPELNGALAGQTAMVTGESDVCGAAKVLKNFHAEFAKPELRAGILDNAILSLEQLRMLADLPPMDVLRGQFLGVLMAPATKLVRVFNEPGASLARLLKAKAEKDGGEA